MARTHYMDLSGIQLLRCTHMSPTVNASSVLQHFKWSNAVKICKVNARFLPGTATNVDLELQKQKETTKVQTPAQCILQLVQLNGIRGFY